MIITQASAAYELRLKIMDEKFFPVAPRIRERFIGERIQDFALELEHLHRRADRFAAIEPERRPSPNPAGKIALQDGRLLIDGRPVMEPHQDHVMRALAAAVAWSGSDVLEIGFGLGVSATALQDVGVRSHTIIEANAQVVEQIFVPWRARFAEKDIRLVHAKWQDARELGTYDGILADPHFPADASEEAQGTVGYVTSLFETCSRLLKPSGAFTYFGGHADSISRFEQRTLLRFFSRVELVSLRDFAIPDDSELLPARDYVVVRAVK